MLSNITINHFVIVKSLSLDFQKGLHVLTGETGAGKSIWIDAIEIGLGGRADNKLIYPNETTCDITLCFDLRNLPAAQAFLQSNDLPCDDECIIRRVIDQEKPSRTTINGIPVPQQIVRTFSEHLLSIHGQHQHQRLLKSDEQRDCLDRYAENQSLLSEIQAHYAQWKSQDLELQSLKAQAQTKSSDLNLWQYQLSELTDLQLQENEYDTLFSEYQQLHRVKQFASSLQESFALINGEDAISPIDLIQKSQQRLQSIRSDDAKIHNIQQLLQTSLIHLEEARDALQHYCHDIDFSDTRLEKIEKRLNQLQDVARKHHVDPTQLHSTMTTLQHNIAQLEKSDELIISIENKQKNIIEAYQKNAQQLTARRDKAAKKLAKAITTHMQTLGMQGGAFHIELHPSASPINAYGQEQIQFLIATNPGQTPHALAQIVSGGELSRLSLMIQVLTAEQENTATLIFDEVDVGIGGKTADLVGRLLRTLSAHAQVLCVTHLPQVAANGHWHYKAEKISDRRTTHTSIRTLNETERSHELARMLSGSEITEKSISHANELLAQHAL